MSTKRVSGKVVDMVEQFRKRFRRMGYGEDHFILACHAAFPVAITPDLLYQLWANFKVYPNQINKPQFIDRIAVSDVLLWSGWRETGLEVYELEPALRIYLLDCLFNDSRFGERRLTELAQFLQQYVEEIAYKKYGEAFVQTQRYTALMVLAPETAEQEIAKSLINYAGTNNQADVFRTQNFIEAMVMQNTRFERLLNLSKGIKSNLLGNNTGDSKEFFEQVNAYAVLTDQPDVNTIEIPQLLKRTFSLPVLDPPLQKSAARLYALLVGIDKYPGTLMINGQSVELPQLRGGVQDAMKMNTYLREHALFEPHIELLIDTQATKNNIVQQFRQQLGKAQMGDSVLFYFSGFGAQEQEDEAVWHSKVDSRLNCLACFFDETFDKDFLLADKELEYLIHELSRNNPHIVTIFDCSYSANIILHNKNGSSDFDTTVEKSIPFVFPLREWDHFLFGEIIDRKSILELGTGSDVLPVGKHIQLSASKVKESAMEVNGEGVFTKVLLTVLKAEIGSLTYADLASRTSQYLRNVYNQSPVIRFLNVDEAFQRSSFLNAAVRGKSGAVIYDEVNGWLFYLGSDHEIDETKHTVTVIDTDDGLKSYPAKIKSVQAKTTSLRFDEQTVNLDNTHNYKGYVEKLMTFTFRLHVKNIDGYPADLQRLMNELYSSSNRQIELEDDESKAHYVVRCWNGTFYITKPNDPFRPLVAVVNTGVENSILVLTDDLRQIGQWEYLRSLAPTKSTVLSEASPLKIEVFTITDQDESIPILTDDNQVSIEFHKINGRWKANLRCRLTNTTSQRLFCTVLHLSFRFGSSIDSLLPSSVVLNPGESTELRYKNQTGIPVRWGNVEKAFNWEQNTEYITFISSTEKFQPDDFFLKELPEPKILSNRFETRGTSATKAFLEFDEENDITQHLANTQWASQQITFHFRNPEYNIIDEADLKGMLEDPDIADFAQGLYFDVSVGQEMQSVYSIKKGITIYSMNNDQSQTSEFIEENVLKHVYRWDRDWRGKQFRETQTRFPDKSILVSIGDSWFQHPLIKDTIDNLSQTYPIYCHAAEGKHLIDNFMFKEIIEIIDRYNAKFLLISLGFNDLLGKQFESFLVDNTKPTITIGQQINHFLKPSFAATIEAIETIYSTFFRDMQIRAPGLHTIVHGYDHVIPIDSGSIGNCLLKKEIHHQNDRILVVKYIIDQFNDSLKQIASQFSNVTYLDLRGAIAPDQWYDEVHPNEYGFRFIAEKFAHLIEELFEGSLGSSNLKIGNEEKKLNISSTSPVKDKEEIFEVPETVNKEQENKLLEPNKEWEVPTDTLLGKGSTLLLAFSSNEEILLQTTNREYGMVMGVLEKRMFYHDFNVVSLNSASKVEIGNKILQWEQELCLFLFSGHVGHDQLIVKESSPNSVNIASMLSRCKNLKVVILNGSSTVEQVKLLHQSGIPIVIGTNSSITDQAATEFIFALFDNLSTNGLPIRPAFLRAVDKVSLHAKRREVKVLDELNIFEESGEPVWGLYYQKKYELLLDTWHLPFRDNEARIGKLNEHIEQVFADIAQSYNISSGPNSTLIRLPLSISEPIRQLLAKSAVGEVNRVLDTPSWERFRVLLQSYQAVINLSIFALFGEARNRKLRDKNASLFSEQSKQAISAFLNSSDKGTQLLNLKLLETLGQDLVKEYESSIIIQDIIPLLNRLENDSYRHAINDLESKITDQLYLKPYFKSKNEALRLCLEAEINLSKVLFAFGFWVNYSLISVRKIEVQNDRYGKNLIYRHQIINMDLNYSNDFFLDDVPLESMSIILLHRQVDMKSWRINLSPFLVDKNSLFGLINTDAYHLVSISSGQNNKLEYRSIEPSKDDWILLPGNEPQVEENFSFTGKEISESDFYTILHNRFADFAELVLSMPLDIQ